MKRTFTTLLMLVIATVGSYAATYYSTGSVDPRTLTNWKTNTDGTGTSPADFTTASDVFIVQVGHEMLFPASGATWNITGAGATLRILGKLTAGRITTVATFEVANGGYYVQNYGGASGIMPGTDSRVIGETSTVEIINYDTSQRLPDLVWGNLIISFNAGANWTATNTTTFETKGDLIIKRTGNSNVRYLLLTGGTINAVIGGDLIVENGIFALSGSTVASNDECKLTIKGNLIVEDNGGTGALATMMMTYSNANNAIFSLVVEGNAEIRNGNFEASRVNTNNSSNINMDFHGNFSVSANGKAILSNAANGAGTIKAISMVVGGNMEVNGTFTGTAGSPWTSAYGGATVYFKGGAASSTFKMAAGQGATNIAYIVGKDKTLTLETPLVTDKFLAVAGHVNENGNTITGAINALTNTAIAFNGDITANAQSKITLQDGETALGLGLVPGMEVTSLAGNLLSPNTVITQIVDESTITISRAAINGATAYLGTGVSPVNFNIEANAGTLPLTLIAFSAARELNGVKLQWKTAQESNVKQIVLERSTDGVAFVAVAALNANNNVGEHTYSYLDRAVSFAHNNYYRLKIEDYDGSSTYSKEVVVNPLSVTVSEIKVYPNPANSYLEIGLPTTANQGSIKIVSIEGRVVREAAVTKNVTNQRVDISSLVKGLYVLVFENGRGDSQSARFIKN